MERVTDGDVPLRGETENQRRRQVLRHEVEHEVGLADHRVVQRRHRPGVLQLLYTHSFCPVVWYGILGFNVPLDTV